VHDMLGKRHFASATCQLRYSMAIPVEERQAVREVYDVKAGMKGKQHGSKLMEGIIKEADVAKKILMLLPDSARLEAWYAKFGFEKVQEKPVALMLRNPKV